MSSGNVAKAKLLGKSFGAANSQLRKALLFELAKRLDLVSCYRCGVEIVDINDFSVEHKEAWAGAEDPVKVFFDLDNIAFSHIRCNVAAAYKPHKKYDSIREKRAAYWKRYYGRKSEQVLSRKRDRYHRSKQVP